MSTFNKAATGSIENYLGLSKTSENVNIEEDLGELMTILKKIWTVKERIINRWKIWRRKEQWGRSTEEKEEQFLSEDLDNEEVYTGEDPRLFGRGAPTEGEAMKKMTTAWKKIWSMKEKKDV